jgi:hypothetical protein
MAVHAILQLGAGGAGWHECDDGKLARDDGI